MAFHVYPDPADVPEAVAAGRVVGSSFSSPRRYAILSVGSSDGVRIGMPVRSPDGLVGRVLDAGRLASRVMLVSDRQSVVPARLLRTGVPVIAEGRGDGTIDVRPLEVGRNPFKRGDILVTSGTGGLYPPLIPVARIVRLDDDGAIAVPLADPANTSFAIVEPPYEPAAGAAAARRADPAVQLGEPISAPTLDGLRPHREQPQVVGVHDRLLSSGCGSMAGSTLSLANAFAHWLLTVPTEMPSCWATSLSEASR